MLQRNGRTGQQHQKNYWCLILIRLPCSCWTRNHNTAGYRSYFHATVLYGVRSDRLCASFFQKIARHRIAQPPSVRLGQSDRGFSIATMPMWWRTDWSRVRRPTVQLPVTAFWNIAGNGRHVPVHARTLQHAATSFRGRNLRQLLQRLASAHTVSALLCECRILLRGRCSDWNKKALDGCLR